MSEKRSGTTSSLDLKEELIQEEVNKRVALVLQQLQTGTIRGGPSEFKMLFIDKNFVQFLVRNTKSIIIAAVGFVLGLICAFVWSYIVILIVGFVVGYSLFYWINDKRYRRQRDTNQ